MDLTREQIAGKIKSFTDKHKQVNDNINELYALSKKLEGALEMLQLLLKDMEVVKEESVNKE
jgi:hypothetical protein